MSKQNNNSSDESMAMVFTDTDDGRPFKFPLPIEDEPKHITDGNGIAIAFVGKAQRHETVPITNRTFLIDIEIYEHRTGSLLGRRFEKEVKRTELNRSYLNSMNADELKSLSRVLGMNPEDALPI